MQRSVGSRVIAPVALLAEGVDRNASLVRIDRTRAMSPSSRRAWIEIPQIYCKTLGDRVALLAEGVDRNLLCPVSGVMDAKSPSSRRAWIEMQEIQQAKRKCEGRPPRGGRG